MYPLAFALMMFADPAAAPVDHAPLACVPADRYARVAARVPPGAATVDLQFRTTAEGGWYATRMTSAGEEWAGFLPRPARAGGDVEYRIVVTGASADAATAGPFRARVGGPGECDGAGQASVDAPIVVTVPQGAPLVPPVPAGFSPAGVVAAAAPKKSNLALKIAGGAAAAGVVAVTAAGAAESASEDPSTQPIVPPISFDDIEPPPGSTLVFNRDRLAVLMRLGSRPNSALTLFWRVELLAADGRVCVEMNGADAAVIDSNEITLRGTLTSNGSCARPFDSAGLHIGISHQGQQVYEETLALPYHVQ